MSTAVGHGIEVNVRVRFAPEHSDLRAGRFWFTYRITIVNKGERTVQLMRRHWTIIDTLAGPREVQGDGVVGEQTILALGEKYTYSSFCDLRGGIGRMSGTYRMRDTDTEEPIEVAVPEFVMRCPYLAN